MVDDRTVIAVVPARGGSKTIPDKNLRRLGTKPLVAWSVDVAHSTPAVDRVVVSTDDDRIAEVAREYDAEVVDRPAALASDDALVVDTLRHVVSEFERAGDPADHLVMLEPTCPLRSPDDVEACVDLLLTDEKDSVATFTDCSLNPHRAWRRTDDGVEPFVEGADPWQPRQALPDAYQLNGGVYAMRTATLPDDATGLLFGETGAVWMPPERSADIDDETDLVAAEAIVERALHESAAPPAVVGAER